MGNFVFNYNKIRCIIGKRTTNAYKTFKQFFILQIVFELLVLNVKIEPKCRNKDWVLGQKRVFDSVHSRTQSPSYARSTERDKGLWPNPYQTGI